MAVSVADPPVAAVLIALVIRVSLRLISRSHDLLALPNRRRAIGGVTI